jgi:hypothetical protein
MDAAERGASARLLAALLTSGGTLSVAEIVPRMAQRLSSLLDRGADGAGAPAGLAEKLAAAEDHVYADADNPLVCWGPEDLAALLRQSGFDDVSVETQRYTDARRITNRELDAWCAPESSYGRALAHFLEPDDRALVAKLLHERLAGRDVAWSSTTAFIAARR